MIMRPMKALVKLFLASARAPGLPWVTSLTPATSATIAKMRKEMVRNHLRTVLKRTTRWQGEQLVPEQGIKPVLPPGSTNPLETSGCGKVSYWVPWAEVVRGRKMLRQISAENEAANFFISDL